MLAAKKSTTYAHEITRLPDTSDSSLSAAYRCASAARAQRRTDPMDGSGQPGVAIVMRTELSECIIDWHPIYSRIALASLASHPLY
ncbi:hypothetical protein GJ496_005845 [Pomphorhynchus laevis]|nr:hypothetical protein GJ496_005845 [Pomphorhynchus laevis]